MPSHLGLSDRYQPFTHLVAPRVDIYRAILQAFVSAKRQFVVHLRLEDVEERLPPGLVDRDALGDHLRQLVGWDNLRADQDNARVATPEEFHRARYLYQLTRVGEATERGLETFDDQIGRRGALQAVALIDVESRLRQLLRLCQADQPAPAEVAQALRDLVGRSSDLADNASAFVGSLQNSIDLHDADVERFIGYRNELIDYLERFLRQLITVGASIATLLLELDDAGVDRLLRLVAERDAQDAHPDDASSSDRDPVEQALDTWRARWSGLYAWFLPSPGHDSQAQLLRQRARSAIPQLLTAVARLNERREGRSDRTADFTTLARWFAEAPSDHDAHRLWRAAFGLTAARHLAIDPDTVRARERATVPPSTPWADAPPLLLSPRLRQTGSYERRGRPNRVRDRTAERELLATRVAAEAAEIDAAREALLTNGTVRLSALGPMEPRVFRVFLGLLGDALSAWRRGDDNVATTTSDGALLVELSHGEPHVIATVDGPGGTLRGPDLQLRIARTGA